MFERRPLKRKGMELQVSFLVVMIISIVIFGFGMYIISQFFSATKQIQGSIDTQTQAEIERRLMDSGDKVSIPFNRKTVALGEVATFGLGILNSAESRDQCTNPKGGTMACNKYRVAVSFSTAIDAQTQQTLDSAAAPEVDYINQNWVTSSFPAEEFAPNQLKVISLPVRVGQLMKGSPSLPTKRATIYVFNVCVGNAKTFPDQSSISSGCATITPTFVDSLHGQKVLKLYVQVA